MTSVLDNLFLKSQIQFFTYFKLPNPDLQPTFLSSSMNMPEKYNQMLTNFRLHYFENASFS